MHIEHRHATIKSLERSIADKCADLAESAWFTHLADPTEHSLDAACLATELAVAAHNAWLACTESTECTESDCAVRSGNGGSPVAGSAAAKPEAQPQETPHSAQAHPRTAFATAVGTEANPSATEAPTAPCTAQPAPDLPGADDAADPYSAAWLAGWLARDRYADSPQGHRPHWSDLYPGEHGATGHRRSSLAFARRDPEP